MKIMGFEFGRARPQETATPAVQNIARSGKMALSARRFDASFTDRLVSSWTKTDQTVNQSPPQGFASDARAQSRFLS